MSVILLFRFIFQLGLASLLAVTFSCHAQSAAAQIEYRGEMFKLTKSYSNYEDYENDPNNIDPAEVPRIERMMSQVKIGPDFSSWADFSHQAFAIKFPGYGFGGGPKVKSADRQFQVSTIEIPRTPKERYFVLEKFADGKYRLVDDFVMEDPPGAGYPGVSTVELISDELVYFDRNRRILRSAKVSGRASDLRILEDGTFDIDGHSIASLKGLERFLDEHKLARIHVVASRNISHAKVDAAMSAIRKAGGADTGFVGNVAPK